MKNVLIFLMFLASCSLFAIIEKKALIGIWSAQYDDISIEIDFKNDSIVIVNYIELNKLNSYHYFIKDSTLTLISNEKNKYFHLIKKLNKDTLILSFFDKDPLFEDIIDMVVFRKKVYLQH